VQKVYLFFAKNNFEIVLQNVKVKYNDQNIEGLIFLRNFLQAARNFLGIYKCLSGISRVSGIIPEFQEFGNKNGISRNFSESLEISTNFYKFEEFLGVSVTVTEFQKFRKKKDFRNF
jgi:hypothetical protein